MDLLLSPAAIITGPREAREVEATLNEGVMKAEAAPRVHRAVMSFIVLVGVGPAQHMVHSDERRDEHRVSNKKD
jgi:PhoPQ-activated pathogenicity-related protein